MVAANVEIYAAGARDGSDDCKVPRCFLAEDSSRLKAVLDRRCLHDHTRDFREVTRGSRDSLDEFGHLGGVEIESQAARNRDSAPVARSATLH